MKKYQKVLFIASVFGALAVILGAFGAHGLKEVLNVESLNSYNTGIRYHFYHALILVGLALLLKDRYSKWFYYSAIAFAVGIVLFSCSIYLLATREVIGLSNYKWLGPITPIGGVFFIIGWGLLGVGAVKGYDK